MKRILTIVSVISVVAVGAAVYNRHSAIQTCKGAQIGRDHMINAYSIAPDVGTADRISYYTRTIANCMDQGLL